MVLGIDLKYLVVSVPICRSGEIRYEPRQPEDAHYYSENDDALARPTRCDTSDNETDSPRVVIEPRNESEDEVAHDEQAYENEREQKYERNGGGEI